MIIISLYPKEIKTPFLSSNQTQHPPFHFSFFCLSVRKDTVTLSFFITVIKLPVSDRFFRLFGAVL